MTDGGKRRARTSGGELAYLDVGDGPPVLLLHGFPTSSFLWRHLVPAFAPTHRVVAPDLLGHGDSEKPEDVSLGLRAQAGYVRDLLDGLDIGACAVVGHGTGGGVAQALALDGGVLAMALLDSVAFDRWPSDAMRDLQALDASGRGETFVRAAISTAFDLGMGRRDRLDEESLAEYVRPFEGPDGPGTFSRAAAGWDGRGLEDARGALGSLEVPVLLVWGEDDPFVPVDVADELNEAIPTSSLALLPGCSHFVTEDAPEALGPLLAEWLRSRYLGRPHGHAPEGPVPVALERRPPDPTP